MQLTPNFSLKELTVTTKSANNTPSGVELANLKYTATQLEKVRALLGHPITVTSGYRSPEVNKLVGGAKNSQHLLGQAIDFRCARFGTPRQIVSKIIESNIIFDQVICEYDSWVHISFTDKINKRQALIIDSSGTRLFK